MRERSSRAAGLGRQDRRARRSPGAAGRPPHRLSRGILRSCAAGIQRVMTHRAHPMTRRPSRPPCPSSGGRSASCDLAAGGCDRDRRGHDLPPRGLARGSRRWAIRWAKPCRIGPYQAQRRARTGASIWSDLQVFRRVKGPRTPCFTRERSQVRNPPRPSRKAANSRHFVGVAVRPQSRRGSAFRSSSLPWPATHGK
jgi:hypothetical protein